MSDKCKNCKDCPCKKNKRSGMFDVQTKHISQDAIDKAIAKKKESDKK